jgi:hypothetical protein
VWTESGERFQAPKKEKKKSISINFFKEAHRDQAAREACARPMNF